MLQLEPPIEEKKTLPVVVIGDRFNRFGFVVDKFLQSRRLSIQPLDPRLDKIQDINAVSLLEGGSPVLILDVDDIVRSIDKILTGGHLKKFGASATTLETSHKKRVLVVDDSLTVREVEKKLLQNHGYEVEAAVDGMDGWNAVRSGSFDLVITDIDMPRMNGFELVQRIKSSPDLKSIPVAIVSYKEREEDRIRGLDAGANYYLTKSSFHDETLLRAVVDLIGEASG